MVEKLILTVPETTPNVIEWRINRVYLDVDTPAIKLDLESNTETSFLWRLVPSNTVPAADIRAILVHINLGRFKTIDNITLQQYLLNKVVFYGGKVGTISA